MLSSLEDTRKMNHPQKQARKEYLFATKMPDLGMEKGRLVWYNVFGLCQFYLGQFALSKNFLPEPLLSSAGAIAVVGMTP
ncbi:MAG: hypothetical protein IJI53_12245 [Clostridia bacterium]|nr:hypothetical protein [Clostridia bacterium]